MTTTGPERPPDCPSRRNRFIQQFISAFYCVFPSVLLEDRWSIQPECGGPKISITRTMSSCNGVRVCVCSKYIRHFLLRSFFPVRTKLIFSITSKWVAHVVQRRWLREGGVKWVTWGLIGLSAASVCWCVCVFLLVVCHKSYKIRCHQQHHFERGAGVCVFPWVTAQGFGGMVRGGCLVSE